MSQLIDTILDGAGELVFRRNDRTIATVDASGNITISGSVNGGSLSAPAPSGDTTGATDTAALQSWLTAWAVQGGTATLPVGTYYINTQLTYTGTKNARLYGYGATIQVGTSFPIGGSPAWAMIRASASNLRIYGLTLDGNNLANRGFTLAASSAHIGFTDCEFRKFAQQATETEVNCVALRLEGNITDVTVDRCYFHNIVAGANNLASFARGVLISDPSAAGVSTNIKIRGCTFTDITWTGTLATDADAICIQDWTTNASLVVDSCYFKNLFKRAVKIQTPGVTVSNNVIENVYLGTSGINVAGATDPQVFAAISVYANDCVVANNNIFGGSWFQGIEVGTSSTTVNRVSVIGNRVNGGVGATMTGSGGIRIYGDNTCSDFQVTGNYVGRFTNGIWLSTAAIGVNVSGNMVNGYSVATTSGVLVDGQGGVAPSRPTINANSFEGTTRYGIETSVVPTDMVAVGNMGGRTGFQVIQPAAFATPGSKRMYVAGNAGSGSASGGEDGTDGTQLNQGGVLGRVIKFVSALTYSSSITPDAKLGDWQPVTVTNSTAFTVNAPTNPPSLAQTQQLTIEVFNSSGGAMGAITWNAIFVLQGGAFTNPATTKKRFITFQWNGAAWVEVNRAGADY